MTAKRVASAHKPRPTIAEAVNSPGIARRALRLAKSINRRYPNAEPQQDVESVLYAAIFAGLTAMEELAQEEEAAHA